jgi:hypothetical protein
MTREPPDTPFWRKIRARAKHYGVDRLSDDLLLKIARVSAPHLRSDRWAAIAIIVARKLPIPVQPPSEESDRAS